MDEVQKAAYVMAQTACALIEAMGMVAENEQRKALGQSMAYTEDAFVDLPNKYGIHNNATIGLFHNK